MTKDLGMIGEEMQVVVQAHKIVEEKKNWKEVMVVMALLNNVWKGNFRFGCQYTVGFSFSASDKMRFNVWQAVNMIYQQLDFQCQIIQTFL